MRPVQQGNLACQLFIIRDRMLICTSYLCWVFYILFECGEKSFSRRVNPILHSGLIYINVLVFTIKMTKN